MWHAHRRNLSRIHMYGVPATVCAHAGGCQQALRADNRRRFQSSAAKAPQQSCANGAGQRPGKRDSGRKLQIGAPCASMCLPNEPGGIRTHDLKARRVKTLSPLLITECALTNSLTIAHNLQGFSAIARVCVPKSRKRFTNRRHRTLAASSRYREIQHSIGNYGLMTSVTR